MKKFITYLMSLFMAVALVTTGTGISVQAASNPDLLVAQYFHLEKDETDPEVVSYTLTAKIPMASVMAPFGSQMKDLVATGAYPHGRDGKNKIAYIRYCLNFENITAPEGVTGNMIELSEDDIQLTSSCSFIDIGSSTKKWMLQRNRLS